MGGRLSKGILFIIAYLCVGFSMGYFFSRYKVDSLFTFVFVFGGIGGILIHEFGSYLITNTIPYIILFCVGCVTSYFTEYITENITTFLFVFIATGGGMLYGYHISYIADEYFNGNIDCEKDICQPITEIFRYISCKQKSKPSNDSSNSVETAVGPGI